MWKSIKQRVSAENKTGTNGLILNEQNRAASLRLIFQVDFKGSI